MLVAIFLMGMALGKLALALLILISFFENETSAAPVAVLKLAALKDWQRTSPPLYPPEGWESSTEYEYRWAFDQRGSRVRGRSGNW